MKIEIEVTVKLDGVQKDITLTIEGGPDMDGLKEQIFDDHFAGEYPGEDEPDTWTAENIEIDVIGWGDVEDYENLQDLDTLLEVSGYNGHYGLDVVSAALACDVDIDDIDEVYNGHHSTDEDFVENLLTEIGDLPRDFPAYIHIDWERTARDIMMDYTEDSGHYFRCM